MFGAPQQPAIAHEKTIMEKAAGLYQKAADLIGLGLLPAVLYFGWEASSRPPVLALLSPL